MAEIGRYELLCDVISNGTPIEVIQIVLQEIGEPAEDDRHEYQRVFDRAMHCMKYGNIAPEILTLLLEYDPECAQTYNQEGNSLLHQACLLSSSPEIVSLLLELNPEAVRMKNRLGRQPIHCACESSQPSLEIIRTLVNQDPETIHVKCEGSLPLHLSLMVSASADVIFTLLDFYPESAGVMSGRSELPLSIACNRRAPIEIIQRLVELYPQGLSVADQRGRIPLWHAILGSNTRLEVVKLFVQ